MAAQDLNNSFRLNLDNRRPLENRKLCPEYSHHSRFTHAPELIPFKVAGSTSAGAAIIRLDRPSGANVLDETDNYRTISNDYDTEQHRKVERPRNYKSTNNTQNDNIKPFQPTKTILNPLSYHRYPARKLLPKERHHWAINGIKHTTLSQSEDLSSKSTTQYNNDYYTKRHSEPLVIVQDREGRRNRSVCFDNLGRCNECGTKHEAWESCDQSTFATSYSYRQLNPIKRGICRPIDGVAATLAPQLHPRYPTTTKDHFVEQLLLPPKIFSKKDKKPRAQNKFSDMRQQMQFGTTYRDLYYQYTLPRFFIK